MQLPLQQEECVTIPGRTDVDRGDQMDRFFQPLSARPWMNIPE